VGLPDGIAVQKAGAPIGNGSRATPQDTFPFALWSAVTQLNDFAAAMWQTVRASGTRDTTCAMVGGIVVTRSGLGSIPHG
jgi:ADP-ribosylglycohydrolase